MLSEQKTKLELQNTLQEQWPITLNKKEKKRRTKWKVNHQPLSHKVLKPKKKELHISSQSPPRVVRVYIH